MRKKQKMPIVLRSILILALIIVIVYYKLEIRNIYKQINRIKVLTIENDSLKILRGFDIAQDDLNFSYQYIHGISRYSSPFNDGKSFGELIKEYVHYKTQDMYGAPRRTGSYKRIHEGIDLFVPENTPLYPVAPIGIVTQVSDNAHYMMDVTCKNKNGIEDTIKVEYGKIVRILYPEGIESLYAHVNEIYVKEGDVVYADTKVALTGYTGNIKSSGKDSHLHIELRDKNKRSFDPENRLHFNQMDYNNFLKYLDTE